MTTLVTFLGRVPKDNNNRYRTTRYRFPDGEDTVPSAFFGYTLAQRIKPQRLVVLGTSGSMWDHLFEGDLQLGDANEDARHRLLEQVDAKSVTQDLLDELAPTLSAHLGIDVRLRLIPYAFDEAEQIHLLEALAEEIPPGSTLHLDVTHGFRHLPMLGLLAAIYLRSARNVNVEAIWYGSYDDDSKEAPVARLDGLLHIHDWIAAMGRYEANGDYSRLAELLQRDGLAPEDARTLQSAQHLEYALNIPDAARKICTTLPRLETRLEGASELFRKRLLERLAWARGQDLSEQQRKLALRALDRGDFLRAAVLGLEAFVTRLCIEAGERDLHDYQARDVVRKRFASRDNTSTNVPEWKRNAFFLLTQVRNAMAHGNPPDRPRVRTVLADPAKLHTELRKVLDQLNTRAQTPTRKIESAERQRNRPT